MRGLPAPHKPRKSVRGQDNERLPADKLLDGLPDEHGKQALHRRQNSAASPSVHPLTRGGLYGQRHQHRVSPNPACKPPAQTPAPPATHQEDPEQPTGPAWNPLVNPLSHPRPLDKNAKNTAPAPRSAGPAPTASTCCPDAPGQYPGRSRSENDPCPGLRRQPTGGACGSFIIRHRCDKVNTLVDGSDGFFCHSVIYLIPTSGRPEAAARRIGRPVRYACPDSRAGVAER